MQLGINAIKQSQKIAFHDSACQFPDNYCHLHHYYKPFCCKIRQSRGKESLHFTSSNLDYTFHIPYTLPFFFEPVKGTPLHYGSCPLSHYIVSYEGIYRKKTGSTYGWQHLGGTCISPRITTALQTTGISSPGGKGSFIEWNQWDHIPKSSLPTLDSAFLRHYSQISSYFPS